VYLAMRPLRENNAFDTYLLPDHLLVDGATKDLGSDYGERLLRARSTWQRTTSWPAASRQLQSCPARRLTRTPAPWSWLT
jgi:hypothetical protein